MQFHALPQCRGLAWVRRLIQVDFNSRRRIGRLRSQHIFEHELTDDLETALLNARTLEVIPPEGETVATSKISGSDMNKFKTFLKNSAALRRK